MALRRPSKKSLVSHSFEDNAWDNAVRSAIAASGIRHPALGSIIEPSISPVATNIPGPLRMFPSPFYPAEHNYSNPYAQIGPLGLAPIQPPKYSIANAFPWMVNL